MYLPLAQVNSGQTESIIWLTAIGLIIALIGVIPTLRRALRATIWRRPALTQAIRSISPQMQMGYYEQLFGAGAFISVQASLKSTVWVHPDAYILALSDSDDKVLLFSITVRNRWYRPKLFRGHIISIQGETLQIKLGKTCFAELPDSPDGIQADVGAHTAHYDEAFWFGNPGHYQYFVYSANLAGHPGEGWVGLLNEQLGPYGGGIRLGRFASGQPADDMGLDAFLSSEAVQEMRKRMRINTLTLSAVPPEEAGFEVGFGAHEHLVRLVYTPSWSDRVRNWWQHRRLRNRAASYRVKNSL